MQSRLAKLSFGVLFPSFPPLLPTYLQEYIAKTAEYMGRQCTYLLFFQSSSPSEHTTVYRRVAHRLKKPNMIRNAPDWGSHLREECGTGN
ncbi:hypothetical protein LZ30DRAFT_713565 [Colletotrichum cereale]|nr:hypothetical protein LZ30DRAFT_713565 [Colletotrichum cereale]